MEIIKDKRLKISLTWACWQKDKLLLHLVGLYGHNWKLLKESSFQARSPLSLKNRYCLLQRRQKRQIKRQQQTSKKPKDDDTQTITPPSDIQLPPDFDINSRSFIPVTASDPASLSLSPVFTQAGATTMTVSSASELHMGGMFLADGGANMQSDIRAGQYIPSIATVEGIGQEQMYNRQQGAAHMGWNNHDTYSNLGFDSLFAGTDVTDMSFHLEGPSKGVLETQRIAETNKPKDKSLELSVTCSMSRLRTMVCRAFESAMTETRGMSDGDQVTVTLQMKV